MLKQSGMFAVAILAVAIALFVVVTDVSVSVDWSANSDSAFSEPAIRFVDTTTTEAILVDDVGDDRAELRISILPAFALPTGCGAGDGISWNATTTLWECAP
jgi:hypothetical protein